MPPNFLANVVVLCFETRCPKPNTFAHLNSKDLAPPKILGWLPYCVSVPQIFEVQHTTLGLPGTFIVRVLLSYVKSML